MNFQQFDMLLDKSQKRISFLVEKITPHFTQVEIQLCLEEMDNKPQKTQKKSKSIKSEFKTVDNENKKSANLSILKTDQIEMLYKTFISREINTKFAIKWRFYRYYKYIQAFKTKSIKINKSVESGQVVDFIIETQKNEIIFVLCFEILNLEIYEEALQKLIVFSKVQKIVPDRVIFASFKSYRDIPIDMPLNIGNNEIESELWVEWTDRERPFKGEDLIVVNKNELKLAGFNHTSMEDLLEYVHKFSKGGQVSIFRQPNFLSEVNEENPEIELIWKGIMTKKRN